MRQLFFLSEDFAFIAAFCALAAAFLDTSFLTAFTFLAGGFFSFLVGFFDFFLGSHTGSLPSLCQKWNDIRR